MTYADWCRKQQDENPAPDAVAKKEPKNGEITHTYVAMKDAAVPMLAPVSVQPAMIQVLTNLQHRIGSSRLLSSRVDGIC